MTTSVLWKETKYEFLKRVRVRAFMIGTFGFPLMFYILFGLLMNQTWGRMNMARYLLATYGVFGVAGVSLFGFGVSLALERGLGWYELKQATPMPPAAYFLAKLFTYTAFSAFLLVVMMALGVSFGHVHLSASDALHLFAVLIAGSIPFGALGLVLGYLANASSAPAFINMIYLPMSFCSGLWMPFEFLPKVARNIAPFLPTFHLSQLAVAVVRGDQSSYQSTHWAVLAAFTVVFLGLASLLHRRSEARQNALL